MPAPHASERQAWKRLIASGFVLTRQEAWALALVLGLFLLGVAVRAHIGRTAPPAVERPSPPAAPG